MTRKPGEGTKIMPDCPICGHTVQENRVEITADWAAEARREDWVLHKRCANAVTGGWYVP